MSKGRDSIMLESSCPVDMIGCTQGYSRMNEFEAHESSYDHQHKKVSLP